MCFLKTDETLKNCWCIRNKVNIYWTNEWLGEFTLGLVTVCIGPLDIASSTFGSELPLQRKYKAHLYSSIIAEIPITLQNVHLFCTTIEGEKHQEKYLFYDDFCACSVIFCPAEIETICGSGRSLRGMLLVLPNNKVTQLIQCRVWLLTARIEGYLVFSSFL